MFRRGARRRRHRQLVVVERCVEEAPRLLRQRREVVVPRTSLRLISTHTHSALRPICSQFNVKYTNLSLFKTYHHATVRTHLQVFTFCVSRRQRKVYCGHARLCVCLSVCLSAAACPHYCTDPDVTWGSGRGCPLVVHYWADLQSVHGLRCYGNIT